MGELDMQTLVWPRGRGFPIGRLGSRLMCPLERMAWQSHLNDLEPRMAEEIYVAYLSGAAAQTFRMFYIGEAGPFEPCGSQTSAAGPQTRAKDTATVVAEVNK